MEKEQEKKNIPLHVGIIMDGNGRWAIKQGKKRSFGHKKGSDNVEKIVSSAIDKGIKCLSLYAFSCENWARPQEEVAELMRLLGVYINKLLKKAMKNGIRFNVMGDKSVLSSELQKIIANAEQTTINNSKLVLNIGINYGGRQEICNAVNTLIKNKKEITVENISSELYTAPFGEPDLIIRTGGELRLSNFMLFQGAYSELYFTDVLWPDFNDNELQKAVDSFSMRNRRFGKVEEGKKC